MDPPVEHVVDVLRGAAAVHLSDVALRIVGVGVEAVVGHIAGRVVSITAVSDVVVGRVNRWGKTGGRGETGLSPKVSYGGYSVRPGKIPEKFRKNSEKFFTV